MKLKHLLILFGSGAIIIALIPITWLLMEQVSNLLEIRSPVPPASADWLKCLPHFWLGQTEFGSDYWQLCAKAGSKFGIFDTVKASANVLAIGFLLIVLGLASFFLIEPEKRRHIRGLKLYQGSEAKKLLAKAFHQQIRATKDKAGIILTENIALPSKQELRQWLIVGAMGSGKTVVIRSLINRWLARKNKCLVLDVQGDFVSSLYWSANNKKFAGLLLNPFDNRSAEWWLGSDICGTEDARQFALKFVSGGTSDPFWSKAASNLLVAVIKSLQAELKEDWSWHHLAKRIEAPTTQLLAWARIHYSPAHQILSKDGSETADSILINFATDFAIIGDIAASWGKQRERRRFSVRRWLQDVKNPYRLVIIGWDASRKETCRAWASALIDLTGSIIASPTYTKGPRVNVILDEFSEFETRMSGVISAIERGRAKNVSTVIGVQSPAQLRDVYKARAEGFASIIGNHIYVQTAPGKDAEEASRFLGMQTVRDREVSYSSSQNGGSNTVSWVEKQVPVFSPSDFSKKLGPKKFGVRVIYAGIGLDAYLLDFPYPEVTNFRPQFVPAEPIRYERSPNSNVNAMRKSKPNLKDLL